MIGPLVPAVRLCGCVVVIDGAAFCRGGACPHGCGGTGLAVADHGALLVRLVRVAAQGLAQGDARDREVAEALGEMLTRLEVRNA